MFIELPSGGLLIGLAIVFGVVLVFVGIAWLIGWFVSHRD